MKTKTLKFKQIVKAPLAEVFSAFTNATALCEWLCNVAQADAREGGRLYMWWNSGYYTSGEFIKLIPDEKIVFSWHGRQEPGTTIVKITLKAEEDGAQLTILHEGIGAGKKWSKVAKEFERSWEQSLENLQSALETGQDLRITRRPMLGLTAIDPINEEVAARLGVPVTQGIRLEGLVEGMGAQAAGFQKDDTIVKIAGQKVIDYPSWASALRGFSAGDKVKVSFYRGSEKQRVKLVLSSLPLPEIPATAEALSDVVHKLYGELNTELNKCLEGVTEETASHHPTPDDWNVKEVLAHLIATERETHSWIAALIERQEADFAFHANLPARVKAIVAVFPTLSNLVKELKRHQAETIALLAALPPEFVSHKPSYWRLGHSLLVTPYHYQNHFEQIRSTAKSFKSVDSVPSDTQGEL